MALQRAHHGARRRGGRALLLGPARLGQLRLAAALAALALAAGGCESQVGATGSAPPPGRGKARVTGVTDGDTITLSGIGRTRLIGVDTPEVYGHAECYGQAASAFTKRVLEPGRVVKVRIGRESHDRYGRTLAYVWLKDGTFFNELLAVRGYATPLTIPPNDDYAKRFVAAARRAREANRGLWGNQECAQENEAPHKKTGCARFATHADAQRWWEAGGRPAGYDGDGDGQVCEDLP